jgi:SAM-dependent methyltransferase
MNTLNVDFNEPSFWEKANATRWGNYLASHEESMVAFARTLAPQVGGHVLDIGCGEGRWSGPLLRSGWRATCLDIDPVALARFESRHAGARCICTAPGDTRFPVEDASVDLILCVEVAEVLESAWFPVEANRMLAPGGLIFGVFYNRNSLRGVFRSLADRASGSRTFYRIGYGAWRRRLRSNGIEIVKSEGICWFPFRRSSNNPLIPFFTGLERTLQLNRAVGLSPWVLFVARRLPV